MLIKPLHLAQAMVFAAFCIIGSQSSMAQGYYSYSVGIAPVPVAVIPAPPVAAYRVPVAVPQPYVAAHVPAPYVAVPAVRYSVARVPVAPPVAYYAPRRVVVRPKVYVPFQPVRNAVRAVTP